MKKLQIFFKPSLSLFILSIFINYTVNASNSNNICASDSLCKNLKGRIVLQVEKNGEAYYINPNTNNIFFLGRPDDAFTVMREQGVGISNENLKKIQIGLTISVNNDTDKDGLSDLLEDAIDTQKNSPDTDNDGYSDKSEIIDGFNPNGNGKINTDTNFSENQKGKILLQVEKNGEAWYVNPENGKRYFLGRPNDAFSVMRELGVGISNINFEKIYPNSNTALIQSPEETQIKECNKISDEGDRELCYLDVVLNASNNPGYSNDINNCENFLEGMRKAMCYSNFALKQNNLLICDNLDFEKNKITCQTNFYNKSSKQQGVGECEKISDEREAIQCVINLAKEKKDEKICESFESNFWQKIEIISWSKYDCYARVADIKNDFSICEKIPEEVFKNNCLKK